MYQRILRLDERLQHRSLFLFGPRQTGKSTLLRQTFPQARYLDLLHADTFREYSANPELLRERLSPSDRVVIIDEIQKLPSLLDEVHGLIERNRQLRFVLTGSSARKLRRGHANLLAGRAHVVKLHPLVSPEVDFARLPHRLQVGGLPAFIDSPEPWADLAAYVGTYLQEEIRGEGLARAIEPFSRFLSVAGVSSGEQLNFTRIGADAEVPARTVREYYQVLEDTLVGHLLPAYRKTVKRKAVATAKFYWFDVGIANYLAGRTMLAPRSMEYGRALEHQVFVELRAYLDYRQRPEPFCYFRSLSQLEVDFVIGDRVGIEVKAGKVHRTDTKGLLALREEGWLKRMIIVANERERRTLEEGIEIYPIADFLAALWADELVT